MRCHVSFLPIAERTLQSLALVARHRQLIAQLVGDVRLVAALAQQRVDRLHVVPVLLVSDLGQVGSAAPLAFLVGELDADAVFADLPLGPVFSLFLFVCLFV